MRTMALLILLIPVLAGCASSRQCARSQEVYKDAAEQAPLHAPEGLQVPEPDPNYAIPEATGEDTQYGVTVTDTRGRSRSRCLDAPPTLTPPALPPEPEPEPEFETEPLSEPSNEFEAEPDEF